MRNLANHLLQQYTENLCTPLNIHSEIISDMEGPMKSKYMILKIEKVISNFL